MKRALILVARALARVLQFLMLPLRRRAGQRPAAVLAYRGYGNRERLHVLGRVVEDTGGPSTRASYSLWAELKRLYRALASWPVADAELRLHCDGVSVPARSDENGFFRAIVHRPEAAMATPAPGGRDEALRDSPWIDVEVELVAPSGPTPVRERSRVLVPTSRSRRVIISDIDDTLMVTGVANRLLMFWRLFAKAADSRVPFPGVAAFYRALHGGAAGGEDNPMLYVSRGPWTIYAELDKFFGLHDIPVGPVLRLRDWGMSFHHPLPKQQKGHKLDLIEDMLSVYGDLPFVLLGDSGQHDPEIYSEIVRRHPRRVEAVYIRDVTGDEGRASTIHGLGRELTKAGADLILSDSTLEMAEHALARGWIDEDALREMRREVSREGRPEQADVAAAEAADAAAAAQAEADAEARNSDDVDDDDDERGAGRRRYPPVPVP
ncbi:App1 family protein [Haliangium ochraceum]|uniref:App1 family protein n=1 Tax=Haliangium ochraceum TaxID=80816 RepID=UPI0018F01CF6|nr:phosphatase domain-containing protein [Haliangium ochraceum]